MPLPGRSYQLAAAGFVALVVAAVAVPFALSRMNQPAEVLIVAVPTRPATPQPTSSALHVGALVVPPTPTTRPPTLTGPPTLIGPPTPVVQATPTIAESWRAQQPVLDAAWKRGDWPASIALLDAFLQRAPGFPQAEDKLYAALIERAHGLLDAGKDADGIRDLSRARDLAPTRSEAVDALLALTPTPVAPPAAPAPGPISPAPVRPPVPAPPAPAPVVVPPEPPAKEDVVSR